jgi:hypothetical protein
MLMMVAAVFGAISSARARWTDFLPKPFENALYVDGFASHESDRNSGGAAEFGWSDTFLKEQVTVYSRGFFYHPRFLRYAITLSGALKQEDFSSTDATSAGWLKGSAIEYDARLTFLPEHPYNFDLFALRTEPLYMEQSSTSHDAVETSNGAEFRYRGKPFFCHAIYLDNTTSSSVTDANVKRLAADGQFFKSYAGGNQVSLNAAVNSSWFTGQGGLDGTSTDYGAGGNFDVGPARLSATVAQSATDQDSTVFGRFENDRFAFFELLSVRLPAQFRTELSYRILDNSNKTAPPGSSSTSELTEQTRQLRFDLINRLFLSLDSRYSFLQSTRTSEAGDSALTTHLLDFTYGKSIPRGRVMIGMNLSRNDSTNTGRTDVVSEAHPGTTVPGSFVLRQQIVDLGSPIDVSLPSPVSPNPIVHLVEGSDFVVSTVGTGVQIDILPLGPPFVIGNAYDVSVTYSLLSGEFEMLTNTYALNASVSLLDNLLTPYVEYVAVRSDVVSGIFPGSSLDSTTKTAGLNFVDGPWRALGEYQSFDWSVSPYQALRGQMQYVGSVSPTTRLYGTASYLHRHYPVGANSELPDPYSDSITNLSGSVQQDFLARALTLAAGGTYTRQQGRVRGDSFSVNASIDWRVGKLDLSAGASGYGSETQTYVSDPFNRVHQYYYFRIRRQFSR